MEVLRDKWGVPHIYARNTQDLFFAPIVAMQNLMKQGNHKIGDYDLIEANEAFASQALADGISSVDNPSWEPRLHWVWS